MNPQENKAKVPFQAPSGSTIQSNKNDAGKQVAGMGDQPSTLDKNRKDASAVGTLGYDKNKDKAKDSENCSTTKGNCTTK